MKKIFILLLAAVATTTSFAQSRTTDAAKDILRGDRDDDYYNDRNDNDRRYNNRDYNYAEVFKRRSFAINRHFDEKIGDVRSSRRLSRREKNRMIDYLEDQRRRELAELRRELAWNQAKSRRNDRDWNDRRN